MIEPRFKIGDDVHLMGVVNLTNKIVDRIFDSVGGGYRYQVFGSPAWFYESQLESLDEVSFRLFDQEEDDEPYDYDGDTGRLLVDGHWVVASSRQWERFQRV